MHAKLGPSLDNFRTIVLSVIPRILGFLDREPQSQTYGCFERYFWHYKLLDFANARFQEGAFLLALLFRNNFSENRFFNNNIIYQWSIAAIKFWERIRNRNGATNEVYPYESSFCATAMSAYAISEALLILQEYKLINIKKTGVWLTENSNLQVSNQEAAAAIALLNIYLLCGEKFFLEAAEDKLQNIIKNQNHTGFYSEYGGYDIGYQSLTLSLLSRYYKKRSSEQLRNSIKKGVQFIGQYIGDDGNYDPSGTSRKSQFLYTYCFSIFDGSILGKIISGLAENRIVNPAWLDDRYLMPLATDYLQTYLESVK